MKRLIVLLMILQMAVRCYSQQAGQPPAGWQLLDLQKDGVFGISLDKAESILLHGRPHQPVTVAVIDGGVDISQPDLVGRIWANPGEIPDNGKDDDHNGFIDDAHGWNFYGTMRKGDEEFDLRQIIQQVRKDSVRFEQKDSAQISRKELPAYRQYQNLQRALKLQLQPEYNKLSAAIANLATLNSVLRKMGKPNPVSDDFRDYVPANATELAIQGDIISGLKTHPGYMTYKKENLERAINYYRMQLAFKKNQDYELASGGPTTYHGTHIAGIIAAMEDQQHGVKGISADARIMVLRAIDGLDPEGSFGENQLPLLENDRSYQLQPAALAIRYATDNGARVINMSFGLSSKMNTQEMRDAVKYAEEKDVLIVHASGNQGQDLDGQTDFPDRKSTEGKEIALKWIEVGASGPGDDDHLAGNFSNYGKASVDVFAPGIAITSTAPRGAYQQDTGTSMAAPVVAGLAALIWEYYPKLTAIQVKDIIMKTVVKRDVLKDKCISYGVVNAYEALKLAAIY